MQKSKRRHEYRQTIQYTRLTITFNNDKEKKPAPCTEEAGAQKKISEHKGVL